MEMQKAEVCLGIDVGGSGIKGAPVDIVSGTLLAERFRLPTPEPSKPQAVAEVIAQVTRQFNWQGPIGVGFPAAIRNGTPLTAANIHKKWIGTNADALFSEVTGCPVCVLNDADAAGLAEVIFGAGKGRKGVIIVVTVGTGLGTALFTDGNLLPNAELGHIEIDGVDAETRASDAARKREDLSWSQWVPRLNTYLQRLEAMFWPDLIILGGGASKKHEKIFPLLKLGVEVLPAQFLNDAGIIGAALIASRRLAQSSA